MRQDKNNIETLRQWSRLFSPPIFKKIINESDNTYFIDKIETKLKNTSKETTNLALIKTFYKTLEKNYRCEYIYKNTLFNAIIKEYGLKSTLTLNEFKIGKSIADLVLLNGSAKIYEIKTELDSLDKLEKQISDYLKFADKVYIVTDDAHATQLLNAYSNSSVGIVLLNKKNKLETIKEVVADTEHLNFDTLFKVLRKQEYLELTLSTFGYTPDVPNTKIFRCCYELLSSVDILEFQKQVVTKLKERTIQNPKALLSRKTPRELKYICNSLDLNEKEYAILHDFLNTKHLCTNPM